MLNLDPLRALAEGWRSDAETFRHRGYEQAASAAESYADDLDEALTAWALEELTRDQAAAEAGVTPDTIGRRIGRGELRFVRLTNLATASLGDIARGLDRSLAAMDKYRSGRLRVTDEVAARLVAYLRRRARGLEEAADDLERTLRHGGSDG